jgi:hypothetical protein
VLLQVATTVNIGVVYRANCGLLGGLSEANIRQFWGSKGGLLQECNNSFGQALEGCYSSVTAAVLDQVVAWKPRRVPAVLCK